MHLSIGVLTGRTPYPNGMAAAQRIRLMARAMAEAGASVNVWVDGLDGWTEARNPLASGIRDGIAYEYLLGKTQASRHKWRRILDRFALARAAGRKLTEAASRQALGGLYFYTSILKPDFERLVVWQVARKRKFPVVLDLCEAPWTLKSQPSVIDKAVSPLWGVTGAICISRYLEEWVRSENIRTGRQVRSLYIPILVDTNEIRPSESAPSGESVLFAGSPVYDETLRFLLAAMNVVWTTHPNCQLVITGGTTESSLGPELKGQGGRIRWAGYVEREALLGEYAKASVLAIPLFDDVRSRARFPTKLGEYLACGRPVVTNRVGEIPHFLEDGLSAWVTAPGDVAAYAAAICRLLEDTARGQEMGKQGRLVAARHFHYAKHGAELCEFFADLSSNANL